MAPELGLLRRRIAVRLGMSAVNDTFHELCKSTKRYRRGPAHTHPLITRTLQGGGTQGEHRDSLFSYPTGRIGPTFANAVLPDR